MELLCSSLQTGLICSIHSITDTNEDHFSDVNMHSLIKLNNKYELKIIILRGCCLHATKTEADYCV